MAAAGRRPAAWLLVLATTLLPACGKQGPPLAPLVQQPARIGDLAVRRLGATVYVRFTIPDANQDGSKPADLERVEVYAFTAMRAAAGGDLKNATLVATLPVRRPPRPEQAEQHKEPGQPAAAKPAAPPPPLAPGFDQGAVAVVTETLTAASLVPIVAAVGRTGGAPSAGAPPGAPPGGGRGGGGRPGGGRGGGARAAGARGQATEEGEEEEGGGAASLEPALSLTGPIALPLVGPVAQRPLSRFYVAYGISRKGQKGVASQRLGVPLVPPLGAPGPVTFTLGEKAVSLAWTAPSGIPGPVQQPAGETALRSTSRGLSARVAVAYNVYDVPAPGTAAGPAPALAMPTPLNDKPLDEPAFEDTTFEFGKQRCYAVRAVETIGNGAIEGDPSPVACVTPGDVFPPPAPTSLAAVASENAISLIWEAVDSRDVAGYLVLRGEAPGDKLEAITPAPIRETTYRDASARPGVRYVYAVVAVDTATPPNRSALSNKVEESAR